MFEDFDRPRITRLFLYYFILRWAWSSVRGVGNGTGACVSQTHLLPSLFSVTTLAFQVKGSFRAIHNKLIISGGPVCYYGCKNNYRENNKRFLLGRGAVQNLHNLNAAAGSLSPRSIPRFLSSPY